MFPPMRITAVLLLAVALLGGTGCVVVVAGVASAAAITATTVKTATKVTTATVSTTGKVAAAAVKSSGDVTALTITSAAKLARAGMVVLVDSGSGAVVDLPWREGLELRGALEAKSLKTAFKAAKIFRAGRVIGANLRLRHAAASTELLPGDVVELLR
jgi:hypothetical protein